MAIPTVGAIYSVPVVRLPSVSQRSSDSLKSRKCKVVGLGRQTVSFVSERRPLFPSKMMQSASLVMKSSPRFSRHLEKQSPFMTRVSAVEAQTAKDKTRTTIAAPNHGKTPSLDDGGRGGKGSGGQGGWGGGGGGGGGNWGPSSGGLVLFGILLFLSYLKDLEKDKNDDEDEECEME